MSGEIVVVVYGPDHLRAALAAGAETGRRVVAVSAEAASAYAGAAWFLALIAGGRAEYPAVVLTGILDCGDRAGDAVSALHQGATHLIFTGHAQAAVRLRGIAGQTGAIILDLRPPALDCPDIKDLAYRLRALP